MEVSVSSSLPCRKDAKILLQPWNLAENLHVCSEDHGIAALSGEVGPLNLEQPENALSAGRIEPDVTLHNSKRDDKRQSY